jgi:hypothetical protein
MERSTLERRMKEYLSEGCVKMQMEDWRWEVEISVELG